MRQDVAHQLESVLHHLYISPLEACNLRCQICYTAKTAHRLSNDQMLDFISRYQTKISLQTITFCGGEVFLLPDFIDLVNRLTDRGLFLQIITNGTVNQLLEISHPNLVNLIVSLDGQETYHDQNRGQGRYRQSIDFLKSAQTLGFHTEIFSIITKENMPYINQFKHSLSQELGATPQITFHPRKPPSYLSRHPISNRVGETKGFSFISPADRTKLSKQHSIFPPPQLGCYQISLMSDGQVYGCCESTTPIGTIKDDMDSLIATFKTKVLEGAVRTPAPYSLGCVEPDFLCGLCPRKKGEPCL